MNKEKRQIKTGWTSCSGGRKSKCKTLGGRLVREYRVALELGAGVVALEVGNITQNGITQREKSGSGLADVFAALCRLEADPGLRAKRKAEYDQIYRNKQAKKEPAPMGTESASKDELLSMAKELLARVERMDSE
jgi:hypothetical protein